MSTPPDDDEPVPRLPRGRGMKLDGAAFAKIGMTLLLLIMIVVTARPCANATSKFVTGFGEEGSGKTEELPAVGSDHYVSMGPNMTDAERRAAFEHAKVKAAAREAAARAGAGSAGSASGTSSGSAGSASGTSSGSAGSASGTSSGSAGSASGTSSGSAGSASGTSSGSAGSASGTGSSNAGSGNAGSGNAGSGNAGSGSGAESDACQRAFARIVRIDAARARPPAPKARVDEAIEQCRRGRYAGHDPVLRCAMDSATDDAAAACIDAVIKRSLKPGAGSAKGEGLNPLLDGSGPR